MINESDTAINDEEDAAWASLNTPLTVDELKKFCRNTERLYRINPMLEFTQWLPLGENRYLLAGKNISQEKPFSFEIELKVSELTDGFRVDYSQGIKSSTLFKIEPVPRGSRLTIIDRYERLPVEGRITRLGEVDKSIVAWASYLQKFIILWHRWSGIAIWRWYMNRVWQPMKPAARRITYILLWISVVEVALILLGAAVYVSEYG